VYSVRGYKGKEKERSRVNLVEKNATNSKRGIIDLNLPCYIFYCSDHSVLGSILFDSLSLSLSLSLYQQSQHTLFSSTCIETFFPSFNTTTTNTTTMQLGVYTSLALFVSSGMAAAAAATSGPSTDGSFTNGVPTCGVSDPLKIIRYTLTLCRSNVSNRPSHHPAAQPATPSASAPQAQRPFRPPPPLACSKARIARPPTSKRFRALPSRDVLPFLLLPVLLPLPVPALLLVPKCRRLLLLLRAVRLLKLVVPCRLALA
jgi:hypothetical protein